MVLWLASIACGLVVDIAGSVNHGMAVADWTLLLAGNASMLGMHDL